jgi:hypothetical protein
MTAEILDKETKEELAKNIRLNEGEVPDANFEELEKYLELNPPGTKYLEN